MNDSEKSIPSPCVRNCCLDPDDICLGCFRSYLEILEWSSASNARRQDILELAESRKLTRLKQKQDREQS